MRAYLKGQHSPLSVPPEFCLKYETPKKFMEFNIEELEHIHADKALMYERYSPLAASCHIR